MQMKIKSYLKWPGGIFAEDCECIGRLSLLLKRPKICVSVWIRNGSAVFHCSNTAKRNEAVPPPKTSQAVVVNRIFSFKFWRNRTVFIVITSGQLSIVQILQKEVNIDQSIIYLGWTGPQKCTVWSKNNWKWWQRW